MKIITFIFLGIALAVFVQGLILFQKDVELDIRSASLNSTLYEFTDTDIFIKKGDANLVKVIKDSADSVALDAEIVNPDVELNFNTFLGSYFTQVGDNLYQRDKTKCAKFYIGIQPNIDGQETKDKLRINSLQCN
jgi:hypothetical protein